MNILITNISFNGLTGSELYTYELSRTLVEHGHQVDVLTYQIGNEIAEKARAAGVNLTTEPLKKKYDVLHLHHKPLIRQIIQFYKDIPAVNVIHSEFISPWEDPVIETNIKAYVAVRRSIEFKLRDMRLENIHLIYNPIDRERFKPRKSRPFHPKRLLFIGTKDYLREKVVDYIKQNFDGDVICRGDGWEFYPVWNIENCIHDVDETAGILWGRTMLESWCCNKPHWNFVVDRVGNIVKYEYMEVPKDTSIYDRHVITERFIRLYKSIC